LAKTVEMPDKRKDNKLYKKNPRKKLTFSQLIFIILASVIAIAFLLFSTYTPKRDKTKAKQSSSYSKSVPSFRKDGSLSIISAKNPSPIILDIEVADEEAERMRGLMDRLNLSENAGMLFIFPNEEPRSFWMKNTYISLDIIYINSQKEIVSIQKYTEPKSTYSIPSEKPARYVLEVNAGFTDKFGINPGDKIEYPSQNL
jgi:uncharacterized membrane protein (UPF0127 family)